MGKQALRKGFTGDRQLDEVQRQGAKAAQRSNACPFLDGNLVKELTFAIGVVKVVDHGLGREPQGFFVVRSYGTNAVPAPRESTAQPPDRTKQIGLITTNVSTLDIWFF